MLNYGYDLFNPNDSFYHDICTEYTSVNGTDVILSDRIAYYFNDTETGCQKDCTYSGYSAETQHLKCECSVSEEEIKPEKEVKFDESMLLSSFFEVLKYSNFVVLKCYKLVFSYKGQYNNWGSLIIIGYFIIYSIFNFIYFFRGYRFIKLYSSKVLFDNSNNMINKTENKKDILNKNISKTINKGRKSKILFNPAPRKSKTLKYSKKNDLNKSNSNSGKIIFNKSKLNLEDPKSKKSQQKERNDKKKLNRQNTEKNISGKSKKITIFKNIRNNCEQKAFDNSHQILKKIGNKIKNINNNQISKALKKDISKIKNINININNRNSIKIFNRNSKKKLLNENNKKGPFFYFKGNNFSDFELNELPYEEAVDYDKRSFFTYYFQLIRRESLIIFTFFSWNDYNIMSIKLSKFMFSIALDFAVNVVFFFDESMHKIFLDYGKYNFLAQIPQIAYSTIASESLDVFLRYLGLIEKDIYKIKQIRKKKKKKGNKEKIFKILKCMKIRIFFYFLVTFLFMFFFWYFLSAFCGVYKNTQIFLIKDSMISFGLSLLYPFGLYIIPTGLRILSLLDKKKRLKFLYILSDIIPFI